MDERIRLLIAVIVAAVALSMVGACGADSDRPSAHQVDTVMESLAAAYESQDPYEWARFYTAGGTLDLTEWGGGVVTNPAEIVGAIEGLDIVADFEHARPEHVFVSPDGAAVWWSAWGDAEVRSWMQSYMFGPGARTASRLFDAMAAPYVVPGNSETELVDLYQRYTAAWNGRDDIALAEVYAPDVTIRDDTAGVVWHGIDEVTAALADAPFVEAGPWPQMFLYRSRGRIEAWVIVQLDGDCPRLEARRWVLGGPEITDEHRFTHLESARRCGIELGEGWWARYETPVAVESNITHVIDVAGSPVDLINAEPAHEELARWLVDRFAAAGIGMPDVRAMWFPPAPDCVGRSGLAIPDDARYEGRHTAVLCRDADRLRSVSSESGWSTPALIAGLHELGHLWLLDHVDADTEAAFTERVGLDSWYGSDRPWRDRGVEHAATTLAWGLAGTVDARYPLFPAPECEELAARYELLTGRPPLTECGENGWSP